jgi:hypothetical protein
LCHCCCMSCQSLQWCHEVCNNSWKFHGQGPLCLFETWFWLSNIQIESQSWWLELFGIAIQVAWIDDDNLLGFVESTPCIPSYWWLLPALHMIHST